MFENLKEKIKMTSVKPAAQQEVLIFTKSNKVNLGTAAGIKLGHVLNEM